jgi:hypothetical protein
MDAAQIRASKAAEAEWLGCCEGFGKPAQGISTKASSQE